jgi:hypothetical protein
MQQHRDQQSDSLENISRALSCQEETPASRKRKASCLKSVQDKELWCEGCKKKKKCQGIIQFLKLPNESLSNGGAEAVQEWNCDKSADKALWCPACRSKKRCLHSQYEVKSNIFEDQVKNLPDKRQSKARDFYRDQDFERKSDAQMDQSSILKTGLVNEEAESIEICQVEMLKRKIQKLSQKMMDLEMEKNMPSSENYKERTLYRHTQKVTSYIQQIAQGNSEKMLCLVQKVYSRICALNPKHLSDMLFPKEELQAWELVKSSLSAFFSQIQSENKGRYNVQTRSAYINVAAAVASNLSENEIATVAGKLGISSSALIKGKKSWQRWLSDPDGFFILHTKSSKNKMPEEYIEFVVDMWQTLTRSSERAKDTIRNPKHRSDKTMYRIHWQEDTNEEILEQVISAGKEKFGETFHFSMTYLMNVKPFFIKLIRRDLCLRDI